jgi:hypothetical protein
MSAENDLVEVVSEFDVTSEVLDAAYAVYDGWYGSGFKIDWFDFWDRLESQFLPGDKMIDMGTAVDTPAMRKIQAAVRAYGEGS